MAKAVAARIEGDDYQARFFWFQACRMFQPHTNVVRVSYEWDVVRAFDDVVVAYEPPVHDDRGGLTAIDYFQVKFHVSQGGSITWRALMDPHFIGATSTSFLQRLHDAYSQTLQAGRGCRFILVTPWNIDPAAPLGRLVSNNAGELHLDRLFDGGRSKSATGQIRSAWAAHLGIGEPELRVVLSPLRIYSGWGSLADFNDRLNDKLSAAGLKPVLGSATSSAYDDLIRKLVRAGRTTFTAADIREICEREGLWVGTTASNDGGTDIGIRSFTRRTEYMEDETEHMLDLVRHFADRRIRTFNLWKEAVLPQLAGFFEKVVRSGGEYRLHLDAHTSIAFAAGYHLDTKAGARVSPVQKTSEGRQVWAPAARDQRTATALWSVSVLQKDAAAQDIAVGVSVTHDVGKDVEAYLTKAGLRVREFLHLRVRPGPGNTAIRDGSHANALVQGLVARVRERRAQDRRDQVAHVFIAAPNAFTFFLGQHGRALGRTAIYEYDFDTGALGAYEPSMRFPEDVPRD